MRSGPSSAPGGGCCSAAASAATGPGGWAAEVCPSAGRENPSPIANTAGYAGSVIVNEVRHQKGITEGFDARTDKYCDMIDAGIIDPTKVVRIALQNAASVAGLMLTTEALISEIPEEKKDMGGGMPGGAPGMDF